MPGPPSGRTTSSCQTVIHAFRRRRAASRRIHGPIAEQLGSSWSSPAIVARRGRPRPTRAADRRLGRDEPTRRDAESPGRPASPSTRSRRCRDVRIPARDGSSCRRTCGCPAARDGTGRRAVPGHPRDDPVRQGRLARDAEIERGDVARRARLRCAGSTSAARARRGGVALDEYTGAETLDGYDAVEWLAAQPWCNGAVGMWGSLRRVHLDPGRDFARRTSRAIVPIHGDRRPLPDDVHYIGGCVTVSELSQYAVSMVGMNAMPGR